MWRPWPHPPDRAVTPRPAPRSAICCSVSGVSMVTTLHPMYTPELGQMQKEGYSSQLTKLDQRFG